MLCLSIDKWNESYRPNSIHSLLGEKNGFHNVIHCLSHSPLRKGSLALFYGLRDGAQRTEKNCPGLCHQHGNRHLTWGLQLFNISVEADVSQQNNSPSRSYTLTSEKSLPCICISLGLTEDPSGHPHYWDGCINPSTLQRWCPGI